MNELLDLPLIFLPPLVIIAGNSYWRVNENGEEREPSGFSISKVTVAPIVIVLPAFLATRVVLGLTSSLDVFFCFCPLMKRAAPSPKLCPKTKSFLPLIAC